LEQQQVMALTVVAVVHGQLWQVQMEQTVLAVIKAAPVLQMIKLKTRRPLVVVVDQVATVQMRAQQLVVQAEQVYLIHSSDQLLFMVVVAAVVKEVQLVLQEWQVVAVAERVV
jgi:hypothetical protein